MNKKKLKSNRLTVTLPSNVYTELEHQALTQDVSIAWIIRKAINRYLDADIPLLSQRGKEGKR